MPMETDSRKVQGQTASLESPVSPSGWGFPRRPHPSDPRTPPSRLDAPWQEAVDSPMRLVTASGQSLKRELGMARALGQGKTEAHLEQSPHFLPGGHPSSGQGTG